MEFVRIADTSELAPGQMKQAQADGQDILLANVDGQYYAVANRCTHLGGLLCDGSLAAGIVVCPRHGARFDVRTGAAVAGPKILFFERSVKSLLSFQVLIDGTRVFVGLPD